MKGLAILDPKAPGGFRKASYGPVVEGKPLRSPAMRKLVQGLVRDQMAFAEREPSGSRLGPGPVGHGSPSDGLPDPDAPQGQDRADPLRSERQLPRVV